MPDIVQLVADYRKTVDSEMDKTNQVGSLLNQIYMDIGQSGIILIFVSKYYTKFVNNKII